MTELLLPLTFKLLPGSDHSASRLLSILGGMATLWVEYG